MLDVLGLDLGVKNLNEEDTKLLKDYENARKTRILRKVTLYAKSCKNGVFFNE